MVLVGSDVVQRAGRQDAPLRRWLANWTAAVENAEWRSLADVRKTYPAADGVKLKSKFVVTVFNVKGNSYRLLTAIDYQDGIVEVLEVLTHAEYDKSIWKEKY
jgi:mRNA interferase HigB